MNVLTRAVAILAVQVATLANATPALTAPGDPDRSFGNNGFVRTGLGEPGVRDYDSDYPEALALQPDGRIVVVGSTSVFDPDADTEDEWRPPTFALIRFSPDGSRDETFNPPRPPDNYDPPPDESGAANDVAIQADGKIVVAGWYSRAPGADLDFAVLRFLPDGTPDPAFGTNGRAITNIGPGPTQDAPAALIVRPDGGILVAGTSSTQENSDFALALYKPDGTLDAGFSGDGVETMRFEDPASVSDMARTPDGGVVIVGWTDAGQRELAAVVVLDEAGRPDPRFDGDGRLTRSLSGRDFIEATAVLDDGRIVLGGSSAARDGTDFVLTRLTPTGEPDESFGTRGTVMRDLGGDNSITDIAVQPNGKIVAVMADGFSALARFNRDGRLDRTFRRNVGGEFTAGALQANGRIVLAGGYLRRDDSYDFEVGRVFGGEDRTRPRIAVRGVPSRVRCTSRSFTARVRIKEPSALRSATVWLDGRRLRQSTRKRFRQRVNAVALRQGRHRLQVRVTDAGGNRARRSVSFRRC